MERAYLLREVPQLHFIVKVVNIPVVAQSQIPMVQTVQKAKEIHQLQFINKVVDAPVVLVVEVQVQVVEETVGIPQLQVVEKIVVIPKVLTVQGALVRRMAQAENCGGLEIRAPLTVESTLPKFVTAPVLEAPPVVVESVQPAPVRSTWCPHPRARVHM